MPMPETPPRLASTSDQGIQQGYAPISWTAVAALIVAGVFVAFLVSMGLYSFKRGQSLIEVWLLFFPAVALVLAFVARKQIRASEGTRTGERYANAAWWLAVLGGVGYVAYLGAIEFTIRNQAQREFATWANALGSLKPNDPKDPAIYEAVYQTILPGARSRVGNPRDTAMMDQTFGADLAAFRQVDVVRICARNPGAVTITPQGVQNWERKPTEVSCTLTATLKSPEGEHLLVVPMMATIDDRGRRQWRILPSRDGFVKSQKLTPYGKEVAAVEASGQVFTQTLLSLFSKENVYNELMLDLGFIQPGWSPEKAAARVDLINKTQGGRAAVGGAAATLPMAWPRPAGWYENLTRNVFAKPDGGPLSDLDTARFLLAWLTPNRLVRGGTVLKSSTDVNAVVQFAPDSVQVRVPVELLIATTQAKNPTAAKGWLVLRTTKETDPKLFADLEAARAAGSADLASVAMHSIRPRTDVSWRLVKFESDLRLMTEAPPEGGGPPTGGPR